MRGVFILYDIFMLNILKNARDLQIVNIDSFNLFIQLSKIEFTSLGLTSLYENILHVSELTGEILDVSINRKIFLEHNGIKIYCLKINRFGTEFLSLGISSKLLKENYFKGISSNTIKQVYNNLMYFSKDYFYISFEDFILGSVEDIDFFVDFKFNPFYLENFLKKNFKFVPDCSYYYTEINELRTFTGFQHSKRSTKSVKNLFFKIYNKSVEFNYKSDVFNDKYFNLPILKDYFRFECTLKNQKHFNLFFNETKKQKSFVKTLENILNNKIKYSRIPFDIFSNVIFSRRPFKLVQYDSEILKIRVDNQLLLLQLLYTNYIQTAENAFNSIDNFFNDVIKPYKNMNLQKNKLWVSRMKRKLKILYNYNKENFLKNIDDY